MKHTAAEKKAEKVEREREREEKAESAREEREEKAEQKRADQDQEKADQEKVEDPSVDLMTLSAVRDLISSRDDNSRARIAGKAAEIRSIALSDEEGRLALYLVHAEGSV